MDMTKFTYVDASGQPHKISEQGKTWVSDEWLESIGWTRATDDYQKPITPSEAKQQKLKRLSNDYQTESQKIMDKIPSAIAADGESQATKITAAQSEFSALKTKFAADRQIILNS